MTTIAAHTKSWASIYPNQSRIFFGTLIDDSMIEGVSASGEKRTGLRDLFDQGLLTSAYNVAKVDQGDASQTESFARLVQELNRVLKDMGGVSGQRIQRAGLDSGDLQVTSG